MKQYKINVYLKDGHIFKPKIELVKNDYNSTEFIFEFDIDGGRNVFEMKDPNGNLYIKDIVDNKITLVDYDEDLNPISLIPVAGTYDFEIVHYDEKGKLTPQEHGYFTVKDEIVEVNDTEIENHNKFPILDSLITNVEKLKTDTTEAIENTNKSSEYAKEQGDYAKKQAQKIIDSNNQAKAIIKDFEENVDNYTTDFNKNATNKLEEYNENNTNKINSYNENASTKLKDYNDNHTEKVNSYDTNAGNQVKSYNSNATLKIDEYNTNHTNKLKSYNDNDTSKKTAYNQNHDEKLKEYNDNDVSKTNIYNENHDSKMEIYNTNHEFKMNEYNENATTKVEEFNENIESLKDELDDCYKNQLVGQVEGTSIQLEDSADARIRSLEIDGATKQETTTDKQLYDVQDYYIDDYANKVDKDDFITLSGNNLEGTKAIYDNYFTKFSDLLKPNTDYALFIEIKNVSGNGYLVCVSKQSNANNDSQVQANISIRFNELTNNSIIKKIFTTKEDFESCTTMLRSYCGFDVGDSGSITFRISVLEDTTITPEDFIYEKFSGGQPSPNPDYPQKIEVLEDTIEERIVNKNLLVPNDSVISGSRNGIDYIWDGTKLTLDGTATIKFDLYNFGNWGNTDKNSKRFLKPGTYTFSVQGADNYNKFTTNLYYNNQIVMNIWKETTKSVKTLENDAYYSLFYIGIQEGATFNNETFYFQLEEGSNSTVYEPHQEDSIYIDLKENFVAKLSDEIKDTIRIENGHAILTKRIRKRVVDENSEILNNGISDSYNEFTIPVDDSIKNIPAEATFILSELFTTRGITASGRIRISVPHVFLNTNINSTFEERLTALKTKLQKRNDVMYYPLKTPYEVDLGPVKLPKTFKGISNVFLNANLETNIRTEYVKDTQITIDNLQSQIDNITSLLSTTGTSAMLLDNLQSDLEREVIQ